MEDLIDIIKEVVVVVVVVVVVMIKAVKWEIITVNVT
jgi:hypothetical protein